MSVRSTTGLMLVEEYRERPFGDYIVIPTGPGPPDRPPEWYQQVSLAWFEHPDLAIRIDGTNFGARTLRDDLRDLVIETAERFERITWEEWERRYEEQPEAADTFDDDAWPPTAYGDSGPPFGDLWGQPGS